ncbi:MAG: hypothetical protein WBW41_03185 [Verrucomicrobiia bacterium]
MSTTRFAFCILLTTFVLAVGCATPKPTPDPLAGWKSVGGIGYKVGEMHADIEQGPYNKAITDDVQKFVDKLPVYRNYHFFESGRAPVKRRYCYWLEHITLFEDGTGQHAVDMQMEFGGLGLRYVLFYDKLNVRTKAVKIKWHYQS